jgi:hypothetical protein
VEEHKWLGMSQFLPSIARVMAVITEQTNLSFDLTHDLIFVDRGWSLEYLPHRVKTIDLETLIGYGIG